MSTTSQTTETNGNTTTAVAKPTQQVAVYQDLFQTDKFVTQPKVARAFGIKPVFAKDGVTVVGFANNHLKRKDIADAHASGLTGGARKNKVDQVIRESELELAAKITAMLVLHKGKIGAKRFQVRKDKDGVEHYGIQLRQIADTAETELNRLMDAYGAKSPEELVQILTKSKAPVVELDATVTSAQPAKK